MSTAPAAHLLVLTVACLFVQFTCVLPSVTIGFSLFFTKISRLNQSFVIDNRGLNIILGRDVSTAPAAHPLVEIVLSVSIIVYLCPSFCIRLALFCF